MQRIGRRLEDRKITQNHPLLGNDSNKVVHISQVPVATEGHVEECTIKQQNWRCHRGQQPITGLALMTDRPGNQSLFYKG